MDAQTSKKNINIVETATARSQLSQTWWWWG